MLCSLLYIGNIKYDNGKSDLTASNNITSSREYELPLTLSFKYPWMILNKTAYNHL